MTCSVETARVLGSCAKQLQIAAASLVISMRMNRRIQPDEFAWEFHIWDCNKHLLTDSDFV
jgi:hypothetical protein